MGGTVMLVDGCLRLGTPGHEDTAAVVVWPAGSTWDASTNRMLTPGRTDPDRRVRARAGGTWSAAPIATDTAVGAAIVACADRSTSNGRTVEVVEIIPRVSDPDDRRFP